MVKVALMGFGTVGSGVAEVIASNAGDISKKRAVELSLKYILDIREFPDSPFYGLFVKDFAVIENDPEVEVVVETIGGVGIAYEFTKRSLLAGKSVVTSNKELVATKGLELLKIAESKNVNYLFEASVGGGIPIIRPLMHCLSANRVDEIYGIMNGTTNYILTEMIECGTSFDTALKQAQALGFAEQKPDADIEGHDACRKICILSDLAFGEDIPPDNIRTQGITNVTLSDVEYARRAGFRIKLLGRAVRSGDGISAYVAPHLIPENSLLSHVDGVMNGIVVKGNAVGETMFYGAGAGKLPTASAVVADVIDAAAHRGSRRVTSWGEGTPDFLVDSEGLASRWFLRVKGPVPKIAASLTREKIYDDTDLDLCFVVDEKDDATTSVIFIKNEGMSEEDGHGLITDVMDAVKLRALTAELEVVSSYRILD